MMRIAFLVLTLDDIGGTARAVVNLANRLIEDHDVRIISVRKLFDHPHADVDDRITVDYLIDSRERERPTCLADSSVDAEEAARLDASPSVMVPRQWEWQFTALTDVAMSAALPRCEDDVLVTVIPGLLVMAANLLPPGVGLVHQEHRTSFDRAGGKDALLAFAPRADVIAMLGEPAVTWLQSELGVTCPETLVVPNLIPPGYRPRSRLSGDASGGLIVAAGRLDGEKQFGHLVRAFGRVADRMPGWRVRIFGSGGRRPELMAIAQQFLLHDRLELPGTTHDMPSEWARADIAVCCSAREGLPLVAQEAMAAGVPMVAYDCPLAVRDIVRDDENGFLVPPGSEVSLSASLLRLAHDRALRQRLGAAALATAAEYDADTIAARWEDIFTRVVARRRDQGEASRRTTVARTGACLVATDQAPAGVTGHERTPTQARTEVLSIATGLAEESSRDWFVVPADFPAPPRVVLPHSRRREFLARLAAADVPAWLSVVDPPENRWYQRRGTPAAVVEAVRHGATTRLVLEPWPLAGGRRTVLATGAAVHVEFWPEDIDGQWRAPDPNGWVAAARPDQVTARVEVAGLEVPTLDLMTRRTVDQVRFPVDAVYTWVDGTDPDWDAARQQRLAGLGIEPDRRTSGRARYTDHGELRYSLRSLHLFAPWIRRIHLVTAGQRPAWLVDHPKVRVIDHQDLLPADALPTFNSHAIETALHRIPDLAEHFIYFNDDVILGRALAPSDFFTSSGRSAVFCAPVTVGSDDDQDDRPFLLAARRNRELLERELGVTLTSQLDHSPHPHRVSVLHEIEERFAAELGATACAPFRSASDVALLSSFAQHYGLATGTAFVGDLANRYMDIGRGAVRRTMQELLRSRDVDSFCLADNHDFGLGAGVLHEALQGFLEQWAPIRAPWEREAG